MATTQTTRRFFTLKTTIVTGLSIPGPPVEWRWEGRGFGGKLRTRAADVVTPNNPITDFTRVVETWTITSGQEIFNAFFSGFNPTLFENVSLTFTATEVTFHLNREEN